MHLQLVRSHGTQRAQSFPVYILQIFCRVLCKANCIQQQHARVACMYCVQGLKTNLRHTQQLPCAINAFSLHSCCTLYLPVCITLAMLEVHSKYTCTRTHAMAFPEVLDSPSGQRSFQADTPCSGLVWYLLIRLCGRSLSSRLELCPQCPVHVVMQPNPA